MYEKIQVVRSSKIATKTLIATRVFGVIVVNVMSTDETISIDCLSSSRSLSIAQGQNSCLLAKSSGRRCSAYHLVWVILVSVQDHVLLISRRLTLWFFLYRTQNHKFIFLYSSAVAVLYFNLLLYLTCFQSFLF